MVEKLRIRGNWFADTLLEPVPFFFSFSPIYLHAADSRTRSSIPPQQLHALPQYALPQNALSPPNTFITPISRSPRDENSKSRSVPDLRIIIDHPELSGADGMCWGLYGLGETSSESNLQREFSLSTEEVMMLVEREILDSSTSS